MERYSIIFGWRSPQPAGTPTIARFPDPTQPDHVAAVEFDPLPFVGDTQRARADAIHRAARTDYRSPPARLGHLGIDASWLSRQAKS